MLAFMSIQEKLMKITDKCQESLFMQQEERIFSFTCNKEGDKEE